MTLASFPLEPTAAESQAAIRDEFAFFSDWSERYQYLIDLGRKLADPKAFTTKRYKEVLDRKDISLQAKARLAHIYVQLNPAELRCCIDQKIAKLWKISR